MSRTLTYRWQLTVVIPGGPTIQWDGITRNTSMGHDDLERDIFDRWLATPDAQKYKWRSRDMEHRLFAVPV